MCQEFDVNPMLGILMVMQPRKIYGQSWVLEIFTIN